MASAFSQLLILILLSNHIHFAPLQVLALTNQSGHDYSYLKSVYNATDPTLEGEYDYIVIGGGTAGCPLAATLSEKYSVLILERGNVPKAHPNVLNLSGYLSGLQQEDDGTTPAQRFTSEDGIANVRSRVLGGCSMINAGFYSRANKEFFKSLGVKWDMNSVEKAYQWVEETLVSRPRLTLWQSTVRDALLEAGVGPNNGFDLNHKIGTKVSGLTFDESGRRHGAVELLNRGNLKNLLVAVEATVEKIIFSTKDPKPSATGVIYTDSKGKSHQAFLRRHGEIILSAGAIGSPQLLLLSGIGPDSYLSSLGISVVFPQPNVGKFMRDIPRNSINLIIPFPIESSSTQIVGVTSDYFIQATSSSLQFSPTPSPFSLFPIPSSANLSTTTIQEKLSSPSSHGSLWLASQDGAKSSPRVRFNYFSDPVDLSRCVSAMRKIGEMLNTNSMEQFKYENTNGARGFFFFEPSLPTNQLDDSSMEDFCRSTVTTVWHYHGGCHVGKVVDADFRVIGIDSLRVLDGSTFTLSPGTNPQATVMMLGRYVGLKMLRDRKEAQYQI